MASLRAVALCCTLKKSPATSSSDLIAREILTALADHDVDGDLVRVVDHPEEFQALNDVGFTIPAAGGTYWVGEAMQKTNYDQAGPKPDTTGAATKTLAANAAHLARLLKASQYPPS